MKKLVLSYLITVAFLLFVIGVVLHEKRNCPEFLKKVEYAYDTVVILKNNYIPVPESMEKIIYHTTPADTAKIIEDYFSKLYYSDTLINDTTALIIVKDSVLQNRIVSRSWEFQNRRPVQLITTLTPVVPERNKLKFGAGLAIGGNMQNFELAPGIILNKNKTAFTLSYDLYCRSLRIGYYYWFN
jgi:hypothetical protein